MRVALLHGYEDAPDRLRAALLPAIESEPLVLRGPCEATVGPSWLPSAEPDPAGVRAALTAIDEQLSGHDRSEIVLGGFSQGGAASLAATLAATDEVPFAACFVIAGFLWPPDTMEYDFTRVADTPFLFVHGGADESVPAAQGRSAARLLSRRGASVVYREHRDAGHDPATPGFVADIGDWLGALARGERPDDPPT